MSNQIQISKTLDALSISTFVDIGKQIDDNGDPAVAEIYYKRAIRAAEIIFGVYHGEVGLMLNLLAEFYRRDGRLSDAQETEDRIAEIVSVYQYDQQV